MVDNIFSAINRTLIDEGKLIERSKEFASLVSDQQRMEFVQKSLVIQECIVDGLTVQRNTKKSLAKAEKFKDLGTRSFMKNDDVTALEYYTQALCWVPVDTVDGRSLQSLLFANRSACLVHMKLFDPALLDIGRALAAGYPPHLRYKLLERQFQCLYKLNRYSESAQCISAALQCDLKALPQDKRAAWISNMDLFNKKVQSLISAPPTPPATATADPPSGSSPPPFCSGSAHPQFPSLSSSVRVVSSEEAGRSIRAVQDLGPGEVVLIERPFAAVLLAGRATTHCDHCQRRLQAAVVCETCTRVCYCSEECRHTATYHRVECSVLDTMHSSGVGKFGHLALRAITVRPVEFFQEFYEDLKEPVKSTDPCTLGCEPVGGQYLWDSYLPIYHLVSHHSDRSPADLFRRAVTASVLCRLLDIADYFRDCKEDMKTFIASLLLHHLQAFPCNAHEISELSLDPGQVALSVTEEVGAGIYSSLSLFNHSCDPVATRNFYGTTCVVRALRPVARGQEVSDNYGALFATQPREERRDKLREQYYFLCSCDACVADWPMFPDIDSQECDLLCQNCKRTLCRARLGANMGESTCQQCGVTNDLQAIASMVVGACSSYQRGFGLLMSNEPFAALELFLQTLQCLPACVGQPWRDYYSCIEGTKQCYNMMANCHQTALPDQF